VLVIVLVLGIMLVLEVVLDFFAMNRATAAADDEAPAQTQLRPT
jgi:hypothetical protein